MTTIEELKASAASFRDEVEMFLDENEADPEMVAVCESLFVVEESLNEFLGDTEEMPQ